LTGPASLPPAVRELYPFQGRDLVLSSGLRMHYLDEGAGETLLMLHGNPTWSFYYRDLVKSLRGEFRCVVPDHIGCGLSDKPQDWPYRIEDHVANVVELVEALDLRDVTLVVHDWGGAIGYASALRLRERFKRFVVFNSAAFFLPLPRALTALRLPLFGPLVIRGLNGFQRVGFRVAVGHRERFRGAVLDGYMAPYDTWANRIAILRFVQAIPIEPDHPTRALLAELERGLPDLKDSPHLVVWGMRDWVFHPGYLEGWKERFPDAEVHAFDDASHWVVEEAGERALPLLRDFLSRHPLA
jgi:pimeloyl-ACP methyl ester carboxylesterase